MALAGTAAIPLLLKPGEAVRKWRQRSDGDVALVSGQHAGPSAPSPLARVGVLSKHSISRSGQGAKSAGQCAVSRTSVSVPEMRLDLRPLSGLHTRRPGGC